MGVKKNGLSKKETKGERTHGLDNSVVTGRGGCGRECMEDKWLQEKIIK